MGITYNSTEVSSVVYNSVDLTKVYYNGVEVFNSSGGSGPTPLDDGFTLRSGSSKVPGPYDENGYNYNATAPVKEETNIVTIDVSNYSVIKFDWDNDGTTNYYGDISAWVEYGNETESLFTSTNASGTAQLDVSGLTGNIDFTFHAKAQSKSSYGLYSSEAVLNVAEIYGEAQ